MDVVLAKIRRGSQLADVVARVMADTVEFWVGRCMEVVVDHADLLAFFDAADTHHVVFDPIHLYAYPGQMQAVSVGTRHHALADLEALRNLLVAYRSARPDPA